MKKLIVALTIVSLFISTTAFGITDKEYRIQRQQLERIRRAILFSIGNNPRVAYDKEDLTKRVKAIIVLDTQIVISYLKQQEEREAEKQEAEYQSLRGNQK